jgi:DNA-binding NtrC family response regulator
VLIVQDDAPLRRALGRLLKGVGLDVHEIESAAATAWVETHQDVAAVVADQDVDAGPAGAELLAEVQHRLPGVAAFLLVAGRYVVLEIPSRGFIAVVRKPFNPSRLRRAIERAVLP